MSKKEIIVCDRCKAEDEKWKGVMEAGLDMLLQSWETNGHKTTEHEPKKRHLCGRCTAMFDEWMRSAWMTSP